MDDNKTVGNYAYLAFDEGWWRIDNVFTPGLIVDEFLVSGQEVTPGIVVGVILLMLREQKKIYIILRIFVSMAMGNTSGHGGCLSLQISFANLKCLVFFVKLTLWGIWFRWLKESYPLIQQICYSCIYSLHVSHSKCNKIWFSMCNNYHHCLKQ